MRRTITAIIAMALCFMLVGTACADVIQQVEHAIASIGTITIYSNEAITHAEEMYSALTENEKSKIDIEHRMTIQSARNEFNQCVVNEIERINKNFDETHDAKTTLLELYDLQQLVPAGKQEEVIRGLWSLYYDFCFEGTYILRPSVFVEKGSKCKETKDTLSKNSLLYSYSMENEIKPGLNDTPYTRMSGAYRDYLSNNFDKIEDNMEMSGHYWQVYADDANHFIYMTGYLYTHTGVVDVVLTTNESK